MNRFVARLLWQVGEPVHAVVYFAPEVRAATAEIGVPAGWMGYFGCRACPLGPVSAAAASAILFSLAPRMVSASVPAVWGHASPAQLLDARLAGVDLALRRVLGAGIAGGDVRRAAELAGIAASSLQDVGGRPLAAANAALPLDPAPHLALWQTLTTLREHRGEGHIALLVAADVEPCEANVLLAATGRAPESGLKATHKWTAEQWQAAATRLLERGWLEPDGGLSPAGAEWREEIEVGTDRLALGPYLALGERRTDELASLLLPLADAVMASGAVPVPNSAGITWPPAALSGCS